MRIENQIETFSGKRLVNHSNPIVGRSRPSFTLVELLVAMSIIAIISSMVLYTLLGAQRDAKTARTQGTIRKLNDIMLQRWEEFRYRSVKVSSIPQRFLSPFKINPSANEFQTPISAREGARVRMMVLRDTMRMEFPDRYSDILYPPTIYKVAAFTGDNGNPFNNAANDELIQTDDNPPRHLPRDVPGIYLNFRKRMINSASASIPHPFTGGVAPTNSSELLPSVENQGAELLYQIVATSNYQGTNALEYFRPTEIGDTDNDEFPEFIDAWGQPIRWIRWPAGYGVANLPSGSSNRAIQNSAPTDAALNDLSVPDFMDPLRTDWRWQISKYTQKPWTLVPLIISAGPDGLFEIQFDTSSGLAYATNEWTDWTDSAVYKPDYYYIDPYMGFYDLTSGAGGQGGLGQWFDEDMNSTTYGASDNITNYGLLLQ